MTRSPRPRLPLFTGQTLSLGDYRAEEDRARTERSAQRELIAELRSPLSTNGSVLAFHVPNGFWLPGVNKETAAKVWRALQEDGAMPGASDLIIGHAGRTLYLELKRATGGTVSGSQVAFAEAARDAGLDYRVAHGLTQARATLREWGALR